MADKRPATGHTLKEITEFVLRQKAQGTPAERIVRRLTERGWPEATARRFVSNIQIDAAAQRKRSMPNTPASHYWQRILRGLICVLIGLGVIVAGLSSSDAYLGLYYFAMGVLLCIFEAIDFLSGILDWWRNRD
jgi:hypothetical protein